MTAEPLHGVIVKGIGGFYYARAGDGRVYTIRARGAFRKQGVTPLIGDEICFTPGEGGDEGRIDRILPRKNALVRPPVANLSYLLIVVAPRLKPDLLTVDALLVQARRQGIAPALVVNKSDVDPAFCDGVRKEYEGTGDPVVVASAKSGQGLDGLAELLKS